MKEKQSGILGALSDLDMNFIFLNRLKDTAILAVNIC